MGEQRRIFSLSQRIQLLERYGENIAIIEGGHRYTYRELFLRAKSIAVYLKNRGVKRGEYIAVYSNRSFEEVAAYFAVWWCEGVYLPLDANVPLKRLEEYAVHSEVEFILVQSNLQCSIESYCYFRELNFTPIQMAEISNIDSADLELPTVSPDEAAYLMFTSGSTGRPKGVIVPHRGVENLISWYKHHHSYCQNERYSMVAAPGFDASISEIWPPLACGGTLCLMSDDTLLYDPEKLVKWFCDRKINVGYIPTSVLELMFYIPWPDNSMRLIFTGGGRLRRYPPRSFPCPVINQYGLTETTDTSVEAELLPGVSRRTLPPIGMPIEGVEIAIVNKTFKPVPIGETGELLIGGVGVACGYINDRQKSDERFIELSAIPTEFSEVLNKPSRSPENESFRGSNSRSFVPDLKSNEQNSVEGSQKVLATGVSVGIAVELSVNQKKKRYYRTGDLVRYNENGELEYCGRQDRQVKVLGQRVELTEIELSVLKIDEIKNVAVVLCEETQTLVCYYVTINGKEVDSAALIRRLEDSLPKFMIPTLWCIVDKIPLTTNGKIADELLHSKTIISQSQTSPPPKSDTENIVYQFFKEVLKIDGEFSIDTSFFALGGNSLSAGMVLGKINKALLLHLPLGIMLEYSSVRKLANLIDSKDFKFTENNLVKITDNSSGAPLFCIHGFGGYAFQFTHLALYLPSSYPLYILQTNGQGEIDIQDSIVSIARSYLRQIREVQPQGPYRVIGYSFGGLVAIEISRLLIEEGESVDFLGLIDTYGPGYPSLAPLPKRLFIHMKNIAWASCGSRKKYLMKRFDNLLRRFHRLIGKPHDQNLDIPGLKDPVCCKLYFAHEKAWDDYRARSLDLEMHLFRATNDPNDPGTDYSDPNMGWSPFFLKGIHLHRIPGDHFTLFSHSNIETLAREIENSYGRALLLDN